MTALQAMIPALANVKSLYVLMYHAAFNGSISHDSRGTNESEHASGINLKLALIVSFICFTWRDDAESISRSSAFVSILRVFLPC